MECDRGGVRHVEACERARRGQAAEAVAMLARQPPQALALGAGVLDDRHGRCAPVAREHLEEAAQRVLDGLRVLLVSELAG